MDELQIKIMVFIGIKEEINHLKKSKAQRNPMIIFNTIKLMIMKDS